MAKLITLDFSGDFDEGFRITLREEGQTRSQESISLSPNPTLPEKYEAWRKNHLKNIDTPRGVPIDEKHSDAETCIQNCNDSYSNLKENFNFWLQGGGERCRSFIREKLSSLKGNEEEARIVIQTDNPKLAQLPWHEWEDDLFEGICYGRAAIAVGPKKFQSPNQLSNIHKQDQVRILAIIGNSDQIDTKYDRDVLYEQCASREEANIQFEQPQTREELWRYLDQQWHIFFFAGHSTSDEDRRLGRFYLKKDCVEIEDLKYAISKALENGLQLAIFNSCDGLGLANQLAKLYMPQCIVMREEIPDKVAQTFLQSFLTAFAKERKSLYSSVLQARLSLRRFKDDYPGIVCLPVIYQNSAVDDLSWDKLSNNNNGPKPPGEKKIDEKNNINTDTVSLSYSQLLAISQALLKDKNIVVSIKNGQLYLNDQCFADYIAPFSDEGIKSRIERFAKRLGFPNVELQALRYSWEHALAKGQPILGSTLIELAQQGAVHRVDTTDALIKRWREVIEKRLLEAIPSLSCVERFRVPPSKEIYEQTLELAPLLEDWPYRLLNDKEWACAESPLPEIDPMPLDDVWVDIQLIDQMETGNFMLGKDLLQSLESRYEERQWLSEPAQFVLEKLRGSVALIGVPGIGKTTLLKWLTRQLIIQAEGRFLLPLFVPLRKYVLGKTDNIDLLGFAIRQCGISHPDQLALWENTLSYLAGTGRNTILFLLDGWDEVPPDSRESLLEEIKSITHGFATLITSRPSAYPLSLPADDFYEITELSPESISSLIHRWFKTVNSSGQADMLLQHLEAHPDLHRLARNPFLLNLLCNIGYRKSKNITFDFNELPTSRTTLYQQTIEHIKNHHSRRYPNAPFDDNRQRQVERLALWLIAEVPDAPRYVFNSYDVLTCCQDNELLPKVLQPSRLMSQWDSNQEALHFIHTTFHEYLAACELLHGEKGQINQLIQAHAYDAAWQEIFRFLAGGHGDIWQFFWQEMGKLAQKADRFGLIHIKLAHFVAETGKQEGGKSLVGIDLRDKLWSYICKGLETNVFVNAYLDLDLPDYVQRVKTFTQGQNERVKARLLRTLDRAKTIESSQILLQKILFGDENAAAVASYAAAKALNSEGIKTLRNALFRSELAPHTRRWVIRTLGHVRDYESVPKLIEIVLHDDTSASDALRSLGHIGGQTASTELVKILSQVSDFSKKAGIVDALGYMRDALARNALLDELADLNSLDDPLAVEILNALCEKPIPQDSQIIIDFLQSELDESVRIAAAWALMEATESGVTEALAQVAQHDNSEEVRIAALAALRKQARPFDAHWLAERVNDKQRTLVERANALEAVLMMTFKYWHQSYGIQLKGLAKELALVALSEPGKDLTFAAASRGHLLGDTLAPRLMAVCADEKFPYDVREAACTSLGKLKYRGAIEVLLELVRREPETPDDEEIPLANLNQRIARTAAESLCQIDASLLLHEPGQTAQNALARFSITTGHLVFSDHIRDANGRVFPDFGGEINK